VHFQQSHIQELLPGVIEQLPAFLTQGRIHNPLFLQPSVFQHLSLSGAKREPRLDLTV